MYNIQASIPSRLTISVKENIPALTGTVITTKYYFSIEDYLNLNVTINGIIDTLNKINYYYGNLDFSTADSLSSGINEYIKSWFININELNGIPISSSHLQNIKVLKQFTINNQTYRYNSSNRGHIVLPDRYVSGKVTDFVQKFNGRQGDVSGAIELIRMNGTKRDIIDGHVTLTGLVSKESYVIRINNEYRDIYLMNSLKVGEGDVTLATSTNNGVVYINGNLITNNNNVLSTSMLLNNVNVDNNKTAVTKEYIRTYINNNSIIKCIYVSVAINRITLPSDYYILHFYNNEGTLLDMKWTKNGNELILNSNFTGTYTIMKVEKGELYE